jgi:hypothetical protein
LRNICNVAFVLGVKDQVYEISVRLTHK